MPFRKKKTRRGLHLNKKDNKKAESERENVQTSNVSTAPPGTSKMETAVNLVGLERIVSPIPGTSQMDVSLTNVDNFERAVTPNELFAWPIVETPPSLNIERVRLVGQKDPHLSKISGRRNVDIVHYTTAVRKLENHECHVSKTGYLAFSSEVQDGFNSIFTFICNACNMKRTISTNPYTEELDTNVNFAATWGIISNGKGHACMNEVMALMEVPTMASNTFLKYQQMVGSVWLENLLDSMKEAAKEEYDYAVASGSVVGNIGRCAVIVDGGWSHRSYGHSFKANSGVACIIGKYSRKLLFLGVRNKYCCICAFASNKNQVPKEHKCYRNWSGSSPAMEADIIVEGFLCSEEQYQLQYTTFIADGDSSVHSKILQNVPYSRYIRKVNCANHLTKNVAKHLHRIAAESMTNKRLLTVARINHVGKYCRKLITTHSKRQGSTPQMLSEDINNVIFHVFGNHLNCKPYNCEKPGTTSSNVFETSPGEIKARILNVLGTLAAKADSLIEDATSNLAEMYMHLVARFTGGKQAFYGRRNSYNIRCYGAGLSFQYGPAWISKSWKMTFKKSPGKQVKRLINFRERLNRITRVRRRLTTSLPAVSDNRDYGSHCEQPDVPMEELNTMVSVQIETLQINREQQAEIECATRGQADNDRWHAERYPRLTASRFGEICKRRKNQGKLVQNIMYGKLPNMIQIEYGRVNEAVAIAAYSRVTGNSVSACGLFVCTDEGFGFLAGSPDGLVRADTIIEVKCPYSARSYTPAEACHKVKNFYCKIVNNVVTLNRKHNYYYQVQGQLLVTKAKTCDFIVWTPKGISVEHIEVDEPFIEQMKQKLLNFYKNYFAVELVDSRQKRNMRLRNIDD